MALPAPSNPRNPFVRLPQTAPRLAPGTHVVLLDSVSLPEPYQLGFKGSIHKPGVEVPTGDPMVCIECCGPQGSAWKGKPGRSGRVQRETLYILWRYNFEAAGWQEVARAMAANWEWALVLKHPAWRALNPEIGPVDFRRRGVELAGEIETFLESKLQDEPEAVRKEIVAVLYDKLRGKLAS